MLEIILFSIFLFVLPIVLFIILWKYIRLKSEFSRMVAEGANTLASKMYQEWVEKKIGEVEQQKDSEYKLLFEQWKVECEKDIREDAIRRSIRTLLGKVSEQIAPFLIATKLEVDLRDLRFLGTPIDFVAFKGLSENDLEEIIFIEVKSGSPQLTRRERMVKEAIETGNISWTLFPLKEEVAEVGEIIEEEIEKESERQIKHKEEEDEEEL
ncbi:Holliday junction resolvase-like protein [Candidatus Hecatella orcuttiae]|uniref:Holliday junction resolvase-like protein n=1 Tax=Candidatus Hecatella orcuttiae TaxID=1935119 RepID=UPI002867C863|nr:Holliday junction resolvase-like protein [Candidatus Hecatella orcuttiae]